MSDPVTLDVFSDIACPWCYIGKRRLGRALAELPAGSVVVKPRAFELQPGLPPEGAPRSFYEAKFGGRARMEMMFARVTEVGRQEGIAFGWDHIRAPNTRLGHRIVALAGSAADAALDALFRGHFEESADIANLDEALGLLTRHGVPVDVNDLRARLERGDATDEVLADEQLSAELGISGVPFFVADGRLGMSGAQNVDTLRAFLARARTAA